MINRNAGVFQRMIAFLVDLLIAIFLAVVINIPLASLFNGPFKVEEKMNNYYETIYEKDAFYKQYDFGEVLAVKAEDGNFYPNEFYQTKYFDFVSFQTNAVQGEFKLETKNALTTIYDKGVTDGFFTKNDTYTVTLKEGINSFYDLAKTADFKVFISESLTLLLTKDELNVAPIDDLIYQKVIVKIDGETPIYRISSYYMVSAKDIEVTQEYKNLIADASFNALQSEISKLYTNIITLQLVQVGIDLLIAEFLVFMIVPVIFKQPVTLGKLLFKLKLVGKNDIALKPKNLIIRFIVLFILETYSVVFLFFFIQLSQPIILIAIPFISLTIMCFTKDQSALHDIFAKTKVIQIKNSHVFETLEEKEAYLEQVERELQESREPIRDTVILDNILAEAKHIQHKSEANSKKEEIVEPAEEILAEENDGKTHNSD